jgi:hypothetical protein
VCQLTSVVSGFRLKNTYARSDVKLKAAAIKLRDVSLQAKNIMIVIILVDTLFSLKYGVKYSDNLGGEIFVLLSEPCIISYNFIHL